MPGPGPGLPAGLQARAIAMRVMPIMNRQIAQGQQPDSARALEHDAVAQRIASPQGREHFNLSPGRREVEQVHPLGGAPNLHAAHPGLERAAVGEAQDHASGIGKASTPSLGGARPADDPLQAVRALATSRMRPVQRPPVFNASPQGAADIQAQAQAQALGAQGAQTAQMPHQQAYEQAAQRVRGQYLGERHPGGGREKSQLSPGAQAQNGAVERAQLDKAAIERAQGQPLGAQLSSRVDTGAITRGEAEDTAQERNTFKQAFGNNWRSIVYGEDLAKLRAGLAGAQANNPKYQAANKALMQRRALMLEHAKAIVGGKSSGGTTAP
jgi:hypothetical protein